MSVSSRMEKLQWLWKRRPPMDRLRDAVQLRINPRLARLHRELDALIVEERRANPDTYNAAGRLYQSYGRIALYSSAVNEPRCHPDGRVMTVEDRIEHYRLPGILRPDFRVLDIGSNFGFLSVELAHRVAHVDAVEFNALLNRCGRLVADYLGVARVSFHNITFNTFEVPPASYDLILSLAAFATHDKHEQSAADAYFSRCRGLLKPRGYLLYESTTFGCNEAACEAAARAAADFIERSFTVVDRRSVPLQPPLERCYREIILARVK